MMTRSINTKRVLLKKLAVLPLVFCAAFLFSVKTDAMSERPGIFTDVKEKNAGSTMENKMADTAKFYQRLTLKNENGKNYEKLTVNMPDGSGSMSWWDDEVEKLGKAGFLIGNKVYNENQITEVEHLIKTLPLTGEAGVGGNTVKPVPGLDLSAYEIIFYFDMADDPSKAIKPSTGQMKEQTQEPTYGELQAKLWAWQSWEQKEINSRKLSTKQPIEVVVRDYYSRRVDAPLSYLIEAENTMYILNIYGEDAAKLRSAVKPGDKITIQPQSKGIDDITPYVLVSPEYVKKDNQVIFQYKGFSAR